MQRGDADVRRKNVRRIARDRRVSQQLPMTSTLKLDKDCVVDRMWIHDYLCLILHVCESHGVKVKSVKMCQSAHKGQHFYIDITPPVDAALANRIHYLLGDDCRRVDFNQARIESGLAEWSKLFELPNVRLRTIYRNVKVPAGTESRMNGRRDRGQTIRI
jgi:hypothetical protein